MESRTSKLRLAPDDHSDRFDGVTQNVKRPRSLLAQQSRCLPHQDTGPADTTPLPRMKVPALWRSVPGSPGIQTVGPCSPP